MWSGAETQGCKRGEKGVGEVRKVPAVLEGPAVEGERRQRTGLEKLANALLLRILFQASQ